MSGGAGDRREAGRALDPIEAGHEAHHERLLAIGESIGVTRVADVTGLDFLGLPVVAVIRPLARSLTVASGKGVTLSAAVASGVMEALEQHLAENAAPGIVMAPVDAARGCETFADASLLPRDRRAPASRRAEMRWVATARLDDGARFLVPFDLVGLDLTVAGMARSDGFLTSTNGLAADHDRRAAILHAVCELIERDAIALASRPGGALGLEDHPRIDLAGVEDDTCAALLERCRASGLSAQCWDITSDVGVAVVYCRLGETASAPYRLAPPADGAGCDPDPARALRRALTEAAQSRLTLLSGARDDILRHYYTGSSTGRSGPGPEDGAVRRLRDLPACAAASSARRLDWTLAALRRGGFADACVFDFTSRWEDVHAVRVVVPGLEGATLSRGYCPGPRVRSRWAAARPGRPC